MRAFECLSRSASCGRPRAVTQNRTPKTKSVRWAEKIAANLERDARQTELLSEHGWRAVRSWEHDLKGVRLGETLRKIASLARPRANTG